MPKEIAPSPLLLDHHSGLNAFFYVRSTQDRSTQLAQFAVTEAAFYAYAASVNRTSQYPLDADAAAHHLFGSLNSVCVDLRTGSGTSPAGEALRQMTVHDAIGWLCAIWIDPDVTPPEQVRLVALDYLDVPHGWAFHAAGLTPAEALETPLDRALVMAGLRGATLPPVA